MVYRLPNPVNLRQTAATIVAVLAGGFAGMAMASAGHVRALPAWVAAAIGLGVALAFVWQLGMCRVSADNGHLQVRNDGWLGRRSTVPSTDIIGVDVDEDDRSVAISTRDGGTVTLGPWSELGWTWYRKRINELIRQVRALAEEGGPKTGSTS